MTSPRRKYKTGLPEVDGIQFAPCLFVIMLACCLAPVFYYANEIFGWRMNGLGSFFRFLFGDWIFWIISSGVFVFLSILSFRNTSPTSSFNSIAIIIIGLLSLVNYFGFGSGNFEKNNFQHNGFALGLGFNVVISFCMLTLFLSIKRKEKWTKVVWFWWLFVVWIFSTAFPIFGDLN